MPAVGERGRDAHAIDQIRRALAGAGLRGDVSVSSYPDHGAKSRLSGAGRCTRA